MVSDNHNFSFVKIVGCLGILTLLAVINGCGSGGNSNMSGNTNDFIAGKWAIPRNLTVPGSNTTLNLSLAGTSVTGTGTYAIEAGRSGTLMANGTSTGVQFDLTFVYDYGVTAKYTGTLPDANDMTGAFQEGTFPATTMTLVRQ